MVSVGVAGVGVAGVGVAGVGLIVLGVGVGAVGVICYTFKYFDLVKNYLLMCFAGVGVGVGIRFPPVIPL